MILMHFVRTLAWIYWGIILKLSVWRCWNRNCNKSWLKQFYLGTAYICVMILLYFVLYVCIWWKLMVQFISPENFFQDNAFDTALIITVKILLKGTRYCIFSAILMPGHIVKWLVWRKSVTKLVLRFVFDTTAAKNGKVGVRGCLKNCFFLYDQF